MTKGIYGLNLAAVAILAFVLSYFGVVIGIILIAAYALMIEKNNWLFKQTLQAVYLWVVYEVAVTVVNYLFDFFNLFGYSPFLNGLHSFLNIVLGVLFLILAAYAVLRLTHDQDANLPLVSDLADYTMGVVKVATAKPAAPVAPQAPVYQPPQAQPQPAAWQPPVVPVAPVAPPVAAPVAAAPEAPVAPAAEPIVKTTKSSAKAAAKAAEIKETVEPVIGSTENAGADVAAPTSNNWTCSSCGRESFGKFCMGCGKPRQS